MGPHISFIRDGVYGFHPFHGGPAYTAFPSGHIAAICAVVFVLWACYPKFKAFYALFVAAVAIPFLQVSPDLDMWVLIAVAGVIVPIWAIWLGASLRAEAEPDAEQAWPTSPGRT